MTFKENKTKVLNKIVKFLMKHVNLPILVFKLSLITTVIKWYIKDMFKFVKKMLRR